MAVLDSLGIDFMQVFANVVGFAIFVWVMARLAWKPILSFMDKRREEIAENFRRIEEEKADLQKTASGYADQIAKIDEEALKRTNEAVRKGQDSARQIEDEARARAGLIIQKARADTDRILDDARLTLKNDVIRVGVEAGKKAAMEQLDEATHRKLVEKFVEELSDVR